MQLVDRGELPGGREGSSIKNTLACTHGKVQNQDQRQLYRCCQEDVHSSSSAFIDRILHFSARIRLGLESLLKGWVLPTTSFTIVLILMIYGLVRAFEPGRSLQEAGSMIGLFTFGGTFLLATIGVGMWLGRWPEQTREDLLLDMTRTRQSRWKTALLAEIEIWIQKRAAKRDAKQARRNVKAEQSLTLGQKGTAANTAEAVEC